ncbi:3-(2,3-dihydroxyphenyl)propionate dioxygenase, partial [Rhodococcus sp. NCIMB 12038]
MDSAISAVREFVRDFDPQFLVIFGPDHYNGFFYDLMPPLRVGAAAGRRLGYARRPLDVDAEVARLVTRSVLTEGI